MRPAPTRAYIYLVGTALCWSGVFVAVKVAAWSMPVPAMIAARFVAATAVFSLLSAVRRSPSPQVADLPFLALLGVIGVTVYKLLFFYGVTLSTAVNASLIVPTGVPVVSNVLAGFILGEKTTVSRVVGLVLAGASVAITSGAHAGTVGASLLGDGLLVGGLLAGHCLRCWAGLPFANARP